MLKLEFFLAQLEEFQLLLISPKLQTKEQIRYEDPDMFQMPGCFDS